METYLVTVNVVESVEQLLHHFFNLPQAELDVHIGQESSQVVLAKVKDQVKCRLVAVELRR
jgi:hypothetical protein